MKRAFSLVELLVVIAIIAIIASIAIPNIAAIQKPPETKIITCRVLKTFIAKDNYFVSTDEGLFTLNPPEGKDVNELYGRLFEGKTYRVETGKFPNATYSNIFSATIEE